jgi:predicted MFS family arabinose efflux permease
MIKERIESQGSRWIVPFLAALFGMMALQMSSLGFSPLLPAIQKEFSMSYTQVGLFTGMYGLLALALSVPAGIMAKRFGEKRVLATALVFVGLGLFMLGLASGFLMAFISRAIWIGAYRFGFVCVLTAVALTCPPSLKGFSMGIVGSFSSLASVIGAPFGSTIAKTFGWRGGMTAYACAALLGAIVVWVFYRQQSVDHGSIQGHSLGSPSQDGKSAFRMPIVWALALLVGMVGMAAFSVTFFLPSAALSKFKMDAVGASYIISTSYIFAIFVNLGFGYLMDRFNKWIVMSSLVAILIPAALVMTSDNLPLFWVATVAVVSIGFAATNQVYGIAGQVLSGRETGNVMGVVSLGAGFCGYIGPQMLGVLRDLTQDFNAGWYMLAGIATLTFMEILLLKRYTERRTEKNENR